MPPAGGKSHGRKVQWEANGSGSKLRELSAEAAAGKLKLRKPHHKLEPSPTLRGVMKVVYPASLGLLEAVTQICIKTIFCMLDGCLFEGMFDPFLTGSWTSSCTQSKWLWTYTALFAVFIPLTIIWLKIVYTRFEISTGIPIEYGTLFVANNICGLMFFQEFKYLDKGWMKPVTFIGLVIVIFGVAVSSREKLPFKLRCLESRLRSKVGPEVSEDGAVFSLRDP